MMRLAICSLCVALGSLCAPTAPAAQPNAGEPTASIQSTYPRLTSGVLCTARLGDLPDGILLRLGELEVAAAAAKGAVAWT